jgi:hypothetical protein
LATVALPGAQTAHAREQRDPAQRAVHPPGDVVDRRREALRPAARHEEGLLPAGHARAVLLLALAAEERSAAPEVPAGEQPAAEAPRGAAEGPLPGDAAELRREVEVARGGQPAAAQDAQRAAASVRPSAEQRAASFPVPVALAVGRR